MSLIVSISAVDCLVKLISEMSCYGLSVILTLLKPQSNGPLNTNTVIGTLAVDGWAVTFGTARRRAVTPPSPLLAVPNVTAHPSTVSVPTLYHSMWHYNCLCTRKGQTLLSH